MNCTDCHTAIPAGLAHIRSSLFEQLAWCGRCWQVRPSVFVPAQRQATDEKVSK